MEESLRQSRTISLFLPKYPENHLWKFLPVLILVFTSPELESQILRKSIVSYYASDSVLVTATHYQGRKTDPYILLFHQEFSSRGEFDSIASRFVKMRYNCLAVDLRGGEKYGYVENETTRRAREMGQNNRPEQAGLDVKASVDYAWRLSQKPIVLLGSSFSATLCLIEGAGDERVKAVMAFSPGEFFVEKDLRSLLSGYSKRVFVASTVSESPFTEAMFAGTDKDLKTMFVPRYGEGMRGIKALYRENPSYDEYWFAILVFIKNLQP